MLIALPPDRVPAFEAAMAGAPYPAVLIGEVGDGRIRIRA